MFVTRSLVFTVIGGIVGFAATAMWMRGIRLGSSLWTVTASFSDAGGLAERSPVTYRGILVGSVKSMKVTPEAVVAELEIKGPICALPMPVTATVASGSLIGGDAQVSAGESRERHCRRMPRCPDGQIAMTSRQLCDGGTIRGQEAPSLATVTETLAAAAVGGDGRQARAGSGPIHPQFNSSSDRAGN